MLTAIATVTIVSARVLILLGIIGIALYASQPPEQQPSRSYDHEFEDETHGCWRRIAAHWYRVHHFVSMLVLIVSLAAITICIGSALGLGLTNWLYGYPLMARWW